MKFKDKVFPYPVIKTYEDDYVNSTFKCEASYDGDEEKVVITFNMFLNNERLVELLSQNKISFLVHVEESRTMFRETLRFNEMSKTLEIPLDSVKQTVEVVTFLVTNERIENYSSEDFSDWYKGSTFDFEENLIIGFSDLFDVDVTKEDDEMKSVGSIFIVVPNPKIKDIFEIEYTDKVISINVSNEIFELYNGLSKTYAIYSSPENKILLTVMVLPAFVEILNTLKEGYKNYEDNLWFKSLVKAFKEKEIDIIKEFDEETFEGYKFAQIIFDDVISESVIRLNYLKDEGY